MTGLWVAGVTVALAALAVAVCGMWSLLWEMMDLQIEVAKTLDGINARLVEVERRTGGDS